MTAACHYFSSTMRRGWATLIQEQATGQRAIVDVILRPSARSKSTGQLEYPATEKMQSIQLYGPGDILGFHERIVAATTPKRDVGDFEPNYFPAAEFTDWDFAWRFSAKKASALGLSPWITLVVLVAESRSENIRQEFQDLPISGRNLPRRVKVNEAGVLPNLNYAWRWSHTHVMAEEGLNDEQVIEIVAREPERGVCRLLCPRRLRPGVRYAGFVVPTFKLGWLAGMGQELSDVPATEHAWEGNGSAGFILPYYYRWEFRTGLRGDFEHLVRLLEPRVLSGLGVRDLDCDSPGLGVQGVERGGDDGGNLSLEGALRSLDTEFTPWGRDDTQSGPPQTQLDLADLINQPDDLTLSNVPWFHIEGTSSITDIKGRLLDSGTAVEVTWSTDATSSSVEFRDQEGNVYSVNGTLNIGQGFYEALLSDLNPGWRYTFWIVALAEDGTVHQTPEGVFELPPAIVPPIYGRWYRARNAQVDPYDQEPWIDQLNLDPRHRAAAGLGAEVIRKQQEALMASAWDQLGAIDDANDILRRSQAGRETTSTIYSRLEDAQTEDFLQITAPVLRRVLVENESTSGQVTARHLLATETRIPDAAMEPAFRHIARRRGPIRKRQRTPSRGDLLNRLATGELEAAGPPPEPLGMVRMCDISARLQSSLKPTVNLTANPSEVGAGETVYLSWSTTNATSCKGSWSGNTDLGPSGSVAVVPFPQSSGARGANDRTGLTSPDARVGDIGSWTPVAVSVSVTCFGPGGEATASQTVSRRSDAPGVQVISTSTAPSGVAGGLTGSDLQLDTRRMAYSSAPTPLGRRGMLRSELRRAISVSQQLIAQLAGRLPGSELGQDLIGVPINIDTAALIDRASRNGPVDPSKRFCDGDITSHQIDISLRDDDPFAPVADEYDPTDAARAVNATLENWLDVPAKERDEPPTRDDGFINRIRIEVFPKLDPNLTVVNRARKRLPLRGNLSTRFSPGFRGDPLDIFMWAPEFPQPMYEPLRDISHNLLLPGIEKIPQNTVSLLLTNRRFIESHMCGLNHEFAGELVWREYPTDQRGTYFRQFWDVSGYVLREDEANDLFALWKQRQGITTSLSDVDIERRKWFVSQDMRTAGTALTELLLTQNGVATIAELPDSQQKLIERFFDEDASAIESILRDIPDPEDTVNTLVRAVGIHERLDERLRDIKRLTDWRDNPLTTNRPEVDPEGPSEQLVLVIRGDLLKRYPNAVIYAVDAVADSNEDTVPGLFEYLVQKDSDGNIERNSDGSINLFRDAVQPSFPIFKATLPPDLTFFGFAFDETRARSGGEEGRGMFFVIEEPVEEPRFGLDVGSEDTQNGPLESWDDLSWAHFGLPEHFGTHLDDAPSPDPNPIIDNSGRTWSGDNTSSATRAWITLQRPVRICIHANEMIPEQEVP